MTRRKFGWTDVELSVIGQGTWEIGGTPEADARAVAALRTGLDHGLTHIDTAEGYSYGRVEQLVGEAIAGRRAEVFLASKVAPGNASYDGTLRACERSLNRLGTDWLDLYMVHWPSRYPIEETMRAMEALAADRRIRFIGVSNFSVQQVRAAQRALSRQRLACVQLPYSLGVRGIERWMIPYCAEQQIAVVGYSPFAHGNFPACEGALPTLLEQLSRFGSVFQWQVLSDIARRRNRTPRQVALNFLTRHPGVFTIPKASTAEHVSENAGATGWSLSNDEIAALNRAFPVAGPIQHWLRRATRRGLRTVLRTSAAQ